MRASVHLKSLRAGWLKFVGVGEGGRERERVMGSNIVKPLSSWMVWAAVGRWSEGPQHTDPGHGGWFCPDFLELFRNLKNCLNTLKKPISSTHTLKKTILKVETLNMRT